MQRVICLPSAGKRHGRLTTNVFLDCHGNTTEITATPPKQRGSAIYLYFARFPRIHHNIPRILIYEMYKPIYIIKHNLSMDFNAYKQKIFLKITI